MATFTADEYNPLYYYLENRSNPSSYYYDYYIDITFFNDLRWPIPKVWNIITNGQYFEYWSSIIGWPPLEALWMWCFSLIIPSTLALVYFYLSWQKSQGFEGFSWNKLKKYHDDSVDLTLMTWWLIAFRIFIANTEKFYQYIRNESYDSKAYVSR